VSRLQPGTPLPDQCVYPLSATCIWLYLSPFRYLLATTSTITAVRRQHSPAKRTVDFALLVFGPNAFGAKRVETNQDARIAVVVLAQETQQRIATTGRGPGPIVCRHSLRSIRHPSRL